MATEVRNAQVTAIFGGPISSTLAETNVLPVGVATVAFSTSTSSTVTLNEKSMRCRKSTILSTTVEPRGKASSSTPQVTSRYVRDALMPSIRASGSGAKRGSWPPPKSLRRSQSSLWRRRSAFSSAAACSCSIDVITASSSFAASSASPLAVSISCNRAFFASKRPTLPAWLSAQ